MNQVVESYNSEQKIHLFIQFLKDSVDCTCSLYERNVHRFMYGLEREYVAAPL